MRKEEQLQGRVLPDLWRKLDVDLWRRSIRSQHIELAEMAPKHRGKDRRADHVERAKEEQKMGRPASKEERKPGTLGMVVHHGDSLLRCWNLWVSLCRIRRLPKHQ